jgi:hypothetical protein
VAFISRLLHLLAAYPNLKTLELPMPANRACIAALAALPGLRHLTLEVFAPRLLPGEVSNLEGEQLLGAVLAATPQVTHLTLEKGYYSYGSAVCIPPQMRESSNLQVYKSFGMPLVVKEEQHWEDLGGAVALREVTPPVTFYSPPPPSTRVRALAGVVVLPKRLCDIGPMFEALPALDKAQVHMAQSMDTSAAAQVSGRLVGLTAVVGRDGTGNRLQLSSNCMQQGCIHGLLHAAEREVCCPFASTQQQQQQHQRQKRLPHKQTTTHHMQLFAMHQIVSATLELCIVISQHLSITLPTTHLL